MSRATETKELMERIRCQWTLMEVEEPTIRQMRAAQLLWNANLCDFTPPTLLFDMFIVFFLVEIVITFFTGDMIAGEYCDSLSTVASRYLRRGGFVFDLGTSIPVSFVEWALLRHCEEMTTSGKEFNAWILRSHYASELV